MENLTLPPHLALAARKEAAAAAKEMTLARSNPSTGAPGETTPFRVLA
jgi:hypothetical protein